MSEQKSSTGKTASSTQEKEQLPTKLLDFGQKE